MSRAALPIKARLTAAFAISMAAVVAGLSVFVYSRTGSDLLDAIDAGLRSRAELIASDLRNGGPSLSIVQPNPIRRDEVYAQIAARGGPIVQSSSVISRQRPLPASAVRTADASGRSFYTERWLTGIDNPARVFAVPVDTRNGRFIVLVGASLGDRSEEL